MRREDQLALFALLVMKRDPSPIPEQDRLNRRLLKLERGRILSECRLLVNLVLRRDAYLPQANQLGGLGQA